MCARASRAFAPHPPPSRTALGVDWTAATAATASLRLPWAETRCTTAPLPSCSLREMHGSGRGRASLSRPPQRPEARRRAGGQRGTGTGTGTGRAHAPAPKARLLMLTVRICTAVWCAAAVVVVVVVGLLCSGISSSSSSSNKDGAETANGSSASQGNMARLSARPRHSETASERHMTQRWVRAGTGAAWTSPTRGRCWRYAVVLGTKTGTQCRTTAALVVVARRTAGLGRVGVRRRSAGSGGGGC